MNADQWWSMAWGGGIAVLYNIASYVTYLCAAHRGGRHFATVFFGGMFVRLLVALALVAVTLAFLPVEGPAFIGSFLIVFTVGLALEVTRYARRQPPEGRGGG